jgi:hypothetical protein
VEDNCTKLIINCPNTLQSILDSESSLLDTSKFRQYHCFGTDDNENDESCEDLIGVIFDSFNHKED